MTGEQGNKEKIVPPLENNKSHIVNSRVLPIDQRTREDSIFVPYKTAIDERTGKRVISSWREVDAEKIEKKPDTLAMLEEERLKKNPRDYEFFKTDRLGPFKAKYEENRMYLLMFERYNNPGKTVFLTHDMVDKALNMSSGELEEIKKKINILREAKKQIVKMPKITPRDRMGFNANIVSEYLDRKDDEREEEARKEKKRREEEKLNPKPQIS